MSELKPFLLAVLATIVGLMAYAYITKPSVKPADDTDTAAAGAGA